MTNKTISARKMTNKFIWTRQLSGLSLEIRESLNKFPDFFVWAVYWYYSHETLVLIEVISSGCNALVVPFQQLLESPFEVLLCERVNGLRHSLFCLLNCLITTACEPVCSNSLWQGWSCRLVHCPGGNATDPIWRVLASSGGISSWTPWKPQHNNPNLDPLVNQLWCIDFLTPPTPLITLTDSLPSLNLLCHSKTDVPLMQDAPKTVWSIPYVSAAFLSKFKTEFYCISFF